jgi:hypothetical protein
MTPTAVRKEHQAPVEFGIWLCFVIIDYSPFCFLFFVLISHFVTKARRTDWLKGSMKSFMNPAS